VGMWLKRRLGIPWIADLRDPIVDNFAYVPQGVLADRLIRRLERSVLSRADHCVVTCPDLARHLRARYPDCAIGRVTTITNGFDRADTPDPVEVRSEASRPARFLLAYVGAFYRRQSIEPILQAVRALRTHVGETARLIELRVVGSIAASQKAYLRDEDAAFLTCSGYRPHHEAIREMARADALLLMTPDNEGGRLCIPAKTFEYLAFGRHIIAVVHPDTELWRILAAAGNVTLIRPHDPAGLREAIEACIHRWRCGMPDPQRNAEVVGQFRRDRLAKRFAEVVETCVDGTPDLRLVPESAIAGEAA